MMTYREIAVVLKAHGCYEVRQGKTAHVKWYSPITNKVFPVSNHGSGREIPKPTVRKIEKQSGVKLL
jgi:predicted RNA binding protein YcfA (HicA-like mRNA interferase family)